MSGDKADGEDGPALDPLAQSEIGKILRDGYDEVVKEPVPDKFLALLASLEASEKASQDDGDS